MKPYKLRLTSARVVEPGPGGFYWYYRDGQGAGGIHDFEYLVGALAREQYGGVGVCDKFGNRESVTEFIPIERLESVIQEQTQPEPKTEGPYR